ncbi:hypothetical protein CLU88_2129 [Acidovorax sp. 56]|nr:hypothetical protein CLU88_2129 [Acidovorax sp. 56]
MPLPRVGAGLSPRRATHFLLLRQKKVSKEKATPSLRPLRFAKGQTCVVAVAGCAAELTALRSSSAQTAAASQFTKHGRYDAHATPQPPRRRRSHRGWIAKQPNIPTATRVVAALDPASAAPSAWRMRPRDGAERSDGPKGCWLFGCPIPSVCAEERSGQRIRARDCLSAVKRSEFERDPAGREHRRLPQCVALGTQTVGSPSFAFFSWRCKKRRCPAGGTSRHPPSNQARRKISEQAPASTGSAQTVENDQCSCYQINSC